MSLYLTVSANFRTGTSLPSIDDQYNHLWMLAKSLESVGQPINNWFPPADTEANSLLNQAFTPSGVSTAALALAKADKSNLASDLRTLGVWNGKDEEGAIVYTATYNTGRVPSDLDFSADVVNEFSESGNMVKLVKAVITIWNPMLVKVAPSGYSKHRVFPDRPAVGWMIYLPYEVSAKQVPEAAQIIPIKTTDGKTTQGSLVVTTTDTFDLGNPDHIKRANAIETRLVDQDLLPTLREFVTRF